MKKTIYTFILGAAVLLTSCGGDEETGNQYDYERSDSLSVDYTRQALAIRGNVKKHKWLLPSTKREGC